MAVITGALLNVLFVSMDSSLALAQSHLVSLPVANSFADFTLFRRPAMDNVSPGQKYTCMYSVFPLRVKLA